MRRNHFLILTLCLFLGFTASAIAQNVPPESLTEISVVGDAPYAAPPDFLSVDVRLEQTGASASESLSQLDGRSAKMADAAKAACPEAVVRSRGDKFVSQSPGLLNLKSGTPVVVHRNISVDCANIQVSGKLVDTLLAQGGANMTGVNYSARNTTKAVTQAVDLAGKRGLEKAQALASALGVKLGNLVSSVVTEEPEGEALREQLHQGQPALDFGDKELHVYVALRYTIAR